MIDGCDGCGDGFGCGDDDGGKGRSGCGRALWGLLEGLGCDLPDRRRRRRTTRRRRRGRRGLLGRWAAVRVPAAPSGPVRWWSLPRHLGALAIGGYQRLVSSRTPPRCRYVPTCSSYGADAVRTYGLWTGSRLALGRIHRCTRQVPHGTVDVLGAPA